MKNTFNLLHNIYLYIDIHYLPLKGVIEFFYIYLLGGKNGGQYCANLNFKLYYNKINIFINEICWN